MKRPRILTALATGCAMTLTGCHTSWIDRFDVRPMKYGSLSDHQDYAWSGPRRGYRPCYHYGAPDGCRDRMSVQFAAVAGANQELAEQIAGKVSSDFEFGFQQAFIDIANGGSGALPTVPPPRYWTAPYRTSWGHDKARDWFAGYQAGANSAKCGALEEAQAAPTTTVPRYDLPATTQTNGGNFSAAPIAESTSVPTRPLTWNPFIANRYESVPSPPTSQGMNLQEAALSTPTAGTPATNAPMNSLPVSPQTDAVLISQPPRMTALPTDVPSTNFNSPALSSSVDATAATSSITSPPSSPPLLEGHSISSSAPPPPSVPPPPEGIALDALPQTAIPQTAIPQNTTPQSTDLPSPIPLTTVPLFDTPQSIALPSTTPENSTSRSTVSQSTISQSTTPQSPVPQNEVLQNSVSPQKVPPLSSRWRRLWKTGPSASRSEGASR